MREILFRGKRIDNGKWVEGFYFCMLHDDGSHAHHFIMPLGTDLSLGTPIEKIQVEVDPETACQYTGLTDKNRRKIFEGDILGIETENLSKEDGCFVVEWSEPGSCFVACGKSYLAHFDNAYEDCRQVIGNIFDNPELLEERSGANEQ